MYPIQLVVENTGPSQLTVTIPAGTVFEPHGAPGYQCLVTTQDVKVDVPPGRHEVMLPGACLNHNLAPPSQVPGALTPLRMQNTPGSQQAVWRRVGST